MLQRIPQIVIAIAIITVLVIAVAFASVRAICCPVGNAGTRQAQPITDGSAPPKIDLRLSDRQQLRRLFLGD